MSLKETSALVKSTSMLPTDLLSDMEQQAVEAREHLSAEDVVLPFLRVCQALTPQRDKENAEYIKGIEEGDFFIGALKACFGREIVVVPVVYERSYYEFVPRDQGGGFRGKLEKAPAGWKDRDIKMLLPNGNECVLTHDHYLLIETPEGPVSALFSCAATALGASKKINVQVSTFKPEGWHKEAPPPPRFAQRIKLNTVRKENEKGRWFTPVVEHAGLVTDALYWKAAKEFRAAILGGKIRVEQPVQGEVDPSYVPGAGGEDDGDGVSF